jgi:hypothetical protein
MSRLRPETVTVKRAIVPLPSAASLRVCRPKDTGASVAVSEVVLWQQDTWRCVLCFKGALAHLRLYEDVRLIAEQTVTAGLDAWQQANAWKTALTQTVKAKGA